MPTFYRKHDKKPIPEGAEVVTRNGKTIARWKDKRGLTRSAPLSEDGAKIVVERPCWYFDVNTPKGRETGIKGSRDLEATRKEAEAYEKNAARARAGLPVVDRKKASLSFAEVLEAWLTDLTRLGRDDVYVKNMRRLVGKLGRELKWATVGQVDPRSLSEWLSRYRASGKSDRSTNQYGQSLRAFLNWAVDHGHLETNPVAKLQYAKGYKRVRQRRALTPDELHRLLATSPPGRRFIYLFAAYTGLRKDEMRQLRWGDFEREGWGEPRRIRLRPEATKNRKGGVIELHPSIGGLSARTELSLHATRRHGNLHGTSVYRGQEGRDLPVFGPMPTIKTLKKDLGRAGIPFKDEHGRQADFHALRYTFATMLSRAGVHPRAAMELLRHSDMKLTMAIYTDGSQLPTAEAIGKLPPIPPSPEGPSS